MIIRDIYHINTGRSFAIIDHKRKLILIHIARCGGTSIELALVNKNWAVVDLKTKHLSCSQAKTRYREKWDEYTTFAVVRNPFDRAVSMWATGWWKRPPGNVVPQMKDLEIARRNFAEFLCQLVPHPNEKYNALNYPDILNLPVDRILRYERLTEDLTSLAPDIELPHISKTPHGVYSDYYNAESIKRATEIFQPSLEMFNYEFEASSCL